MCLEIFLADFAVFRVFWGISRKYQLSPVYGGSAVSPILLSSSPLKVPQSVCQSVLNPRMSLTERKLFSKF